MTSRGTRRGRVAVIGAIAAVAFLLGAQPVTAAWSDPEVATASATAGAVTAPVGSTCTRQTNNTQALFSWTQAATGLTRSGYFVGVYTVGGTTALASATIAADRTSVSVNAGSATTTGGQTYQLRVNATSGTWSSSIIVGTFQMSADNATIASCRW